MIRQVAMLHLREGADGDAVEAFERAMIDAHEELPGATHSHLGRHMEGTVGGGDYTWDLLFDEAPEGDAAALVAASPALAPYFGGDGPEAVVAQIDAVRFARQYHELPEPGIRDCVKRTLFLRVEEGAEAEALARFERELRGMPRYIASIRNWACSRTDPALQPTHWTHVWEQEYQTVDGLRVDYMVSPYHWGVVDGWFDAERPQRIVSPVLAHVYCPAASSILRWTEDA